MIITIDRKLLSHFWSKVEDMTNKTGDDCWNWIGTKNNAGYGHLSLIGTGKFIRAHRFSFLAFKQSMIPAKMHICHSCDNPSCVNPWHLDCKTPKENEEDKLKRNRHPNQKKTHCSKGHEFTPENTYIIPSSGSRQCKICIKNHNDARFRITDLKNLFKK